MRSHRMIPRIRSATLVAPPRLRSSVVRCGLGAAALLLCAAVPAPSQVIFKDGFESIGTGLWTRTEGLPPAAGSTLFVAVFTPQSGAATLGTGQATLLLANDTTTGAFRFSFSNLTGPLSGAHIHAPDGQ